MKRMLYLITISTMAFVLVFTMLKDIDFALSFKEFFNSGIYIITVILALIVTMGYKIKTREKYRQNV